jgi:hypothetical protein
MMQLFVVKYFMIFKARILCAVSTPFAQFLLIDTDPDRRRHHG